ncbi:MAG: DNA double-strand break repair nuclease NurA [Candidatus Korarchaeum sp.]
METRDGGHHELYDMLLTELTDILAFLSKKGIESVSEVSKELLQRGLSIKKVHVDEGILRSDLVGADASSFLLPLNVGRIALISAMALGNGCEVEARAVSWEWGPISRTTFKFWYQAQAEALIPSVCLRYLRKYGKPDAVLIDGPITPSEAIVEIPFKVRNKAISSELKEKASKQVEMMRELIELCSQRDIPVMGVVKRSNTRYFLRSFGIETNYTDQYVFHQMLGFRERTCSVVRHSYGSTDVRAFYIKTSRNRMTPPVRVEYPSYIDEDWVASLVASTSLTISECDGIPIPICQVHRRTKISEYMVKEMMSRYLYKMVKEGQDERAIGVSWGVSIE